MLTLPTSTATSPTTTTTSTHPSHPPPLPRRGRALTALQKRRSGSSPRAAAQPRDQATSKRHPFAVQQSRTHSVTSASLGVCGRGVEGRGGTIIIHRRRMLRPAWFDALCCAPGVIRVGGRTKNLTLLLGLIAATLDRSAASLVDSRFR